MARLIFYYPRPVPATLQSGSQVRVAAMLEGFLSLGIDVVVVDGFSKERTKTMRLLARAVGRGERFDALYGELTTMPLLLSDNHHLPMRPVADFSFLRSIRASGAGVGVFYRDVQWRFGPYRHQTPTLKRWPALAAYRVEVAALPRIVDVLFVPSLLMADHVPGWQGHPALVALPPGSTTHRLPWRPHDGLRLLYVGSVRPPVYDVEPLLRAVDANERASITVCCRKDEATLVGHWSEHPRIDVVHAHGDRLVELYRDCDATSVAFPPHPYRDFSMPVKLFESIGMGRPLLASADDMAGEFVAEHALGWAPRIGDLGTTIDHLIEHPDEICAAHDRVVKAQRQHTWEARCEFVLETLVRRGGS